MQRAGSPPPAFSFWAWATSKHRAIVGDAERIRMWSLAIRPVVSTHAGGRVPEGARCT